MHAQLLRLFVTEQEASKGIHNKCQPANAGQQHYSSHKRQSPNQAAVQASNQHTALCATEAPDTGAG